MVDLIKLRQLISDDDEPYTFNDRELDEIIASNIGTTDDETLYASIINCLEILLANSAKMFNFRIGQETLDVAQIFQNIRDLIKYYKEKLVSLNKGDVARIVPIEHKADRHCHRGLHKIITEKYYERDLTRER
jgi:hypothetical protein